MRLTTLQHLLDVVRAIAHPREIDVLGSTALLARHPALGDPGFPLELTQDADLLVEPCDEGQAAVLNEAVGEGSLFHREFGAYADLLRHTIEETLPPDWRARRLPLAGVPGVHCLDVYDMAVVKLTVGRPKDMQLLEALLRLGVLDLEALRSRYHDVPLDEGRLFKAGRNLQALAKSLERGAGL